MATPGIDSGNRTNGRRVKAPVAVSAENAPTQHDLGKLGRVYREADAEKADKETVIQDMLSGQCNQPVSVVAFNTAEGWASDVSEDIA